MTTGAALAELLRIEQEARGLDAVELLDHFAETTSYADPYLAAMLLPGSRPRRPCSRSGRLTGTAGPTLARTTGDETDPLRTLAFGDVFAVNETVDRRRAGSAGGCRVRASRGSTTRFTSTTPATRLRQAGSSFLIVGDGDGGYRRVDFGAVTVPPHTVYGVTAGLGHHRRRVRGDRDRIGRDRFRVSWSTPIRCRCRPSG